MSVKDGAASGAVPLKAATTAPGAAAFSIAEAADETCIGVDRRARKAAQRLQSPSNSRANVVNAAKVLI
jgi:hypothetical protein